MSNSPAQKLPNPLRVVLVLIAVSAIADVAGMIALCAFAIQHGLDIFTGNWWAQFGAFLLRPLMVAIYVLGLAPWIIILVGAVFWARGSADDNSDAA